jgi:hypothetical protein
MSGQIPVTFFLIQTNLGYRAYAEKELAFIFDLSGKLADGTYLADGSITAGIGSQGIIEKSGRVVSVSGFERTIQPTRDNVLLSYQGKQLQHLSVVLDNADHYFTRLIAKEPFLGRPLSEYVGFDDLPLGEHLKIFEGTISEIKVTPKNITLEAEEG